MLGEGLKMKGLLQYQFSNYLRSYRYLPPLSLFLMFLIVNYTYKPNPIVDSYSFTSIMLFFIMGWFTVTVFHAEDVGQKQITLLHLKNRKKYYIGLYIGCALIGLCLSSISVAYPIVFNMFGAEPRSVHIIMGFLSHSSLTILAIALSALFTRDLVKNKGDTWWGVLSILIITVAVAPMKNMILQVKGLIWLFPPVHLSLEMMSSKDTIKFMPGLFYWQFIWVFLYGFLVIGLFFLLIKRKPTN